MDFLEILVQKKKKKKKWNSDFINHANTFLAEPDKWLIDSFASQMQNYIWDKVFKNGLSNICRRQPLKNVTRSILEYFVPFAKIVQFQILSETLLLLIF